MFKELVKKIVKTALKSVRTSSGEFLLLQTNFGLIRAEFVVVQRIAQRALTSVDGINDAEVVVTKLSTANPLKISVTLTVDENYSAPKLSAAADKAINDDLRKFLGLEFYVPVEVTVTHFTQAQPPRRRVR